MIDPGMIVLETAPNPDAVIIWMHGLGADGSDFPPAVPYLKLPEDLAIRFLFPNAPEQAVTINGGWVMRSWYDILSMDSGRQINADQLAQSVSRIGSVIQDQLAKGIDPHRILLVGFSQGGAVAYETGLTFIPQIGGVAAMSTYLPRPLGDVSPSTTKDFPILSLHGEMDDVVPLSLGKDAITQLESDGYVPDVHTFPMAHEVSLDSLTVLGHWITQRLQQESK